ncbi:MAG: murein hydrolase activator EnvC family protein [Thermodesulfobacteriota bacterium]
MFYFSQTIFKNLIPALAVGIVLLLADGRSALSETPPDEPPASEKERIEQEASAVKDKIETRQKEVRKFTRKELETVERLNDIDKSLNQVRKQVSASEKELSDLSTRIEATETRLKALTQRIHQTEKVASRRVVGLYKLNSLGKIHLLAGADSMNDFFQRKNALERILTHDEQLLATLKKQQTELQNLAEHLHKKKETRTRIQSEYDGQMRELKRQKTGRAALLERIRTRKSLARASLFALKRSADKLDQKLRRLQQEHRPKEPAETAEGPFAALKGLLNMPVRGKITSFFGPYKNTEFDTLNFQSGIQIAADRGKPIHSVAPGEVIYSNWFRGYGNMIIIDHGNHYYTLYAHAEELFKSKGEPVKTGETIASVGDTGSISGPGLHFEVRHHGKPVDPLEWLKKG